MNFPKIKNLPAIPQPRHFLNKRSQDLLHQYAQKHGKKHNALEYAHMIKTVAAHNPQAFHDEKSLGTRRFFHCPISRIPYSTCIIAAPSYFSFTSKTIGNP